MQHFDGAIAITDWSPDGDAVASIARPPTLADICHKKFGGSSWPAKCTVTAALLRHLLGEFETAPEGLTLERLFGEDREPDFDLV
jgi:hypothetical protein